MLLVAGVFSALTSVPVQGVAALTVFAIAFAVREQMITVGMRRQLDELLHERVDPDTSLLSATAIPLRLEPELAWAELDDKLMAVLVFQVYGGQPDRAARALRKVMRGHENAFLLAPNRFLVGLWDTDEDGIALAVQRLGGAITAAGHEVVDAGVAMVPADGRELEELLAIAWNNRRPLDQQLPPRTPEQGPRELVGVWSQLLHTLRAAGPGLAMAMAVLLASHLVFPFAMRSDPLIGSARLIPSLLALAAYGTFAGFAIRWIWNHQAPGVPSSARVGEMSRGAALILAAAVFAVLATEVLYDFPKGLQLVPPSIVYAGLLVLPLLQGRFLIRLESLPLLALIAVSAGVVYLTYEPAPVLANVARLTFGIGLGCLLAKNMERLSWVLMVAISISAIDIWSVFAESGVTNKLVEADEAQQGGATSILDILLLTGASIDGFPVFLIGTTDMIFTALFLAFAHFWRLDLLRNVVAMTVGMITAILTTSLVIKEGVPVLPFLAFCFLIVNGKVLLQDVFEMFQKPAAAVEAGGGTRTPAAG